MISQIKKTPKFSAKPARMRYSVGTIAEMGSKQQNWSKVISQILVQMSFLRIKGKRLTNTTTCQPQVTSARQKGLELATFGSTD
jgi:hypothetical protein